MAAVGEVQEGQLAWSMGRAPWISPSKRYSEYEVAVEQGVFRSDVELGTRTVVHDTDLLF